MKARGHIRPLGVAAGVAAFAAALLLAPGTAAAQPDDPTFTRDVAPILQRSCQTCHREGAIAPMSLLTYEETRPWARSIREKVETRSMPPWYIDKNIGVQGFKYDRSLSDAEIETIVDWVDAGAPRGNPADMPPAAEFADRDIWHTGEPDWIVPIPEPFVVPAEGANWWGDLFSESGLTEDRWIKAVETKPSAEGFPVVHHAVTRLQESIDSDEGDFLNEYAQGKNGDVFPEGTGRLVKAGSIIRFNMHYASIGEERTDRTSVGLTFYPKGEEPEHELFSRGLGQNYDLDIPPGEDDVRHDSYHRFDANVRLTGFQPHLHNRGKRQCIEAIYPDGEVETLSCADWDFGWHIVYNYADEVQPLLPKNTILHTITWHDNSRANRWNPDPRNWAGFGQRSSDDMSFTWTSWFELSDEEYEAAVAERQALTANDN
ncbi:MAG: hypothetical protein OXF93_10340 [Acidobacteria bacterium]|nr:hypothetical protein [Acidobacteriota bacterium]